MELVGTGPERLPARRWVGALVGFAMARRPYVDSCTTDAWAT